ncbi:hypothetical protein LZ554_003840 [Drepanopeziza brunnea f. sp. 'monogermtubi']|nr:hypothetical protein LZ554_003840 [Drepanopeziza brunnea f. sp. 'monogermtubi']
MASILCLAHYCDTHGPTPLMVTEGLPVGCTSCFESQSKGKGKSSRRPSSSRSLNPADGLAAITQGANRNNSVLSEKAGDELPTSPTPNATPISQMAIETPPESPRVVALGMARRNSSFSKTYDENDKKKSAPCENCRLTLPKATNEEVPTDSIDTNAPIFRTRKPYERVSVPSPSPPTSVSSSQSSDSENAISSRPSHHRTRSRTIVRVGTSSSNSSFLVTSHEHYLDYTSTHEPLAPTSFSLVRQSCLRTLSCETLPPSPNTRTSSPTSPYINTPFSPGPSSSTSMSGGPIFFGDSMAGYTTAFVFRIPDPNARGRRRVYALIALSTHRERVAMQSFSFFSDRFPKIAAWIQSLAEGAASAGDPDSPQISGGEGYSNYSTPTSSFLSGRNRGADGRYAGMSLRAKGLAELVGMPDFFLELHAVFVRLLVELNVLLGL